MRPWLWVLFYTLFIFSTIPLARDIQRFVYSALAKEFFTYIILFIILVSLTILLYLFVFRFGISRISQYIWLLICAGLYGYYTIKLKKHPEEAVHFLEYGLLSYLFFIAFSRRIKDHTIYITSTLSVLFVGMLDEFIQWMMPERFWDFKDIGLNTLAGAIFMVGLWKGLRPKNIRRPVVRLSVNVLLVVIIIDLLFLGICLSNTPKTVNHYSERLSFLSWLKDEEPMVEYGYKYKDHEIGIIYSRLSLGQLREIDTHHGGLYGEAILNSFNNGMTYKDLTSVYSPSNNLFLHEFIIHLERRDNAIKDLKESINSYMAMRISNIAFKENLILERYFSNTLSHSGFTLPDEIIKELMKKASPNNEIYISKVGKLITALDLTKAWSVIFITIIVLWTGGSLYKRHLQK